MFKKRYLVSILLAICLLCGGFVSGINTNRQSICKDVNSTTFLKQEVKGIRCVSQPSFDKNKFDINGVNQQNYNIKNLQVSKIAKIEEYNQKRYQQDINLSSRLKISLVLLKSQLLLTSVK
ncbi:MAG: hypothetical protein DRJ99_01425 [Thermoplasmata archaeon]|nr:MAG: hypothetical protein DRJ99_01425 [Thermoplasmata archaeon]